MTKKYELLKELPGHKAGTIYHRAGGGMDCVAEDKFNKGMNSICCTIIDEYPDWFELIPEQKSAEEIIEKFIWIRNNDKTKRIINALKSAGLVIVKESEYIEMSEVAKDFDDTYVVTADKDGTKWEFHAPNKQTVLMKKYHPYFTNMPVVSKSEPTEEEIEELAIKLHKKYRIPKQRDAVHFADLDTHEMEGFMLQAEYILENFNWKGK